MTIGTFEAVASTNRNNRATSSGTSATSAQEVLVVLYVYSVLVRSSTDYNLAGYTSRVRVNESWYLAASN